MTNYPIDDALVAVEKPFEIDLYNKVSGATYPRAAVYGANTLGQVLAEYAEDLGIVKDHKILFENKMTGQSTSDLNETVEGLNLQPGDVLAFNDDAPVASSEEAFEIDILNKVVGVSYTDAVVYGANTLGQVLAEYAVDLGLNPDTKDCRILFENKRTRQSTSDLNETIEGLNLQPGDVLTVIDECPEYAPEPEKAFEINLLNKVTGTNYPGAMVYGANTLGQVLAEYAEDLGINVKDHKILFENKRTGQSASDLNETIEGFNIEADDVLAIKDNAGVAAEDGPCKCLRVIRLR